MAAGITTSSSSAAARSAPRPSAVTAGAGSPLERRAERRRLGQPPPRRVEDRRLQRLVALVQAHAGSTRAGSGSPHAGDVAGVDLPLLRRAAGERELRRLAVLEQRLDVRAVLAQDRRRPHAVERLAVAGHDVVGLLDERLEPRERGEVRARRALDHRDLDGREVVAGHQHARPRDPDRHAVVGVAVGGLELELAVADLDAARYVEPLGGRQGERPRPLDVELLVERPQLALGGARLVHQPGRARLRAAQRRLGKRVAAEQVVPVRVRGEQADDAEARLLGHRRQDLELVREDRRVDAEGLAAAADERAGGLEGAGGGDDDVGVEPDGPHAAPRRRAASSRFLTSAVGFLAPGSRVSPDRLTQITGTFAFTHGSTS